jgi:TonB-dependent starch-binding outer membrane protein SusC
MNKTFLNLLKLYLFLLLGISTTLMANAQGTARGKVLSSDDNEPIIGANVVIQGTTTGTTTDVNGNFTIQVERGQNLLVSFIGFKTRRILYSGETTLSVFLELDQQTLDELVVVGYGSLKKSDLTGAVASVSEETLKSTISANIDQALQGRVAGVQVTQNSGQPGGATSIRIRGASSITGSNEPLYVIDGIPFQGSGTGIIGFSESGSGGQTRVNPLSTINPSDIVNIEVLKDASASAIYGAQAANGVILITTKRGKKGDSKISYNGYSALQQLPKKLSVMNLREFAEYQNEIAEEFDQTVNEYYRDPSILGEGTDWQDAIFRQAWSQNHQLSIAGGSDKSQYAISGGYMNQDGIVIGSNFNRYSTRINLDQQVKDWLKVGVNMAFTKTNETITLNDGSGGVITQALVMPPDIPVYDLDGNFAGPTSSFSTASTNPVGLALLRNNQLARSRIMSNFFAVIDFTKDLNLRSEFAFDSNNSSNKYFRPTYEWGVRINTENLMIQQEQSNFFWIFKNYLNYTKTFNDIHSINAMAGIEAQKSTWEGVNMQKKNFLSNDIQVMSQGNTVKMDNATTGFKGSSTMASYFGRLNYNFDERYLATFTLRADGSSRFGPENKWGYFPSGSVAWRASNESFLKDNKTISNLKLRLGYGMVGNQAIPDFMYGSAMATPPVTTTFGSAYRLRNIANPKLKWEASEQFNAGIDLSLFNNRIEFTADAYLKNTKDLLLQLSIPTYLGGDRDQWRSIQVPYANIGKIENKGLEFALITRNIEQKNFSWTSTLNLSINRNKVIELNDENAKIYRNVEWYNEFRDVMVTMPGQPMGMFYGYETEGLFTDADEIMNHAIQVGDPTTIDDNNPKGTKNYVHKTSGIWAGDIRFKDQLTIDADGDGIPDTADGVIDENDKVIIGDPNPDFTFGFNNSIVAGPFELTIYLSGAYGVDIFNFNRTRYEDMRNIWSNQGSEVVNRARIEMIDPNGLATDGSNVRLANADALLPRPTQNDANGNIRMSDRWIEDGSYLRIQNVSISYNLPEKILNPIRIQSAKVYVNVQNLYTLTRYSGYDPEVGAFNQDPLQQNVDMGRYPSPRVFTFGINLDF